MEDSFIMTNVIWRVESWIKRVHPTETLLFERSKTGDTGVGKMRLFCAFVLPFTHFMYLLQIVK